MGNVLPLGADLDEIDLLEEIERTFAIKLLAICATAILWVTSTEFSWR